MPRTLFLKLNSYLLTHEKRFWETITDFTGITGISWEVKLLVFLRLLGTGRSLDDLEYCSKMGRENIKYYFKRFCLDPIKIYGGLHLNKLPYRSKLKTQQDSNELLRFPGCAGPVDFCKLNWKNFPFRLKGQYHFKKEGHLASIDVEAWCDHDLYIWHWFSVCCGKND